jgi:hypothetical protein
MLVLLLLLLKLMMVQGPGADLSQARLLPRLIQLLLLHRGVGCLMAQAAAGASRAEGCRRRCGVPLRAIDGGATA